MLGQNSGPAQFEVLAALGLEEAVGVGVTGTGAFLGVLT